MPMLLGPQISKGLPRLGAYTLFWPIFDLFVRQQLLSYWFYSSMWHSFYQCKLFSAQFFFKSFFGEFKPQTDIILTKFDLWLLSMTTLFIFSIRFFCETLLKKAFVPSFFTIHSLMVTNIILSYFNLTSDFSFGPHLLRYQIFFCI